MQTKTAHLIHVRHCDEVEPPMTDWLQEAYDFSEVDARRFSGIAAKTRGEAAAGPASALRAAAGKRQRKRAPAKQKKAAPRLRSGQARKTAKKR